MKHSYSNNLRYLVGIGLDEAGNHRRLTRGEHFHLVGGSRETHEQMQEDTLCLVERLKKKGKTIVTASDHEFFETAREAGLIRINPFEN
jgi:hypothetical protein